MKDFWTGKQIERTIDSIIFSVNDESAGLDSECNTIETNEEKQTAIINQWIKERANSQHETYLELVSFEIA
jgi:hypothetical protein